MSRWHAGDRVVSRTPDGDKTWDDDFLLVMWVVLVAAPVRVIRGVWSGVSRSLRWLR
jgi:hypothetical protein